ncbi:hypothetical protein V2I01_16285 [Micromonospora sp. BRA006-A]|nr:hypothetical protein [Micromonospora sp. BRA006-A]
MSRGRGAGSPNKRRQVSEQEHAAAVEDYRESVGRLQHTAYRNMRQTVAYATIFVAVIATWMLFIGQATPAPSPGTPWRSSAARSVWPRTSFGNHVRGCTCSPLPWSWRWWA